MPLDHTKVDKLLDFLAENPGPKTEIPTCEHRWPYPAGWNRSTDAEKRAYWPKYCEPCPHCPKK
jgi:hypothetical protein